MKDAFGQVIDPVLRYVIDLRRGADRGEHPAIESVKSDLLGLFAEAEQKAGAARETSASFGLVKYALVYWADEVLINSSWAHADGWRYHILEWEYFRENVGGEKFFEKADEAERLNDTSPLEVFFLCVTLGFQGKLGFDKTQLRRWIERAYNRLAAANQAPERFLPDDADRDALEPLGPLPGKTLLLRVSMLVSASALATLAGFLYAIQRY